MLVLKREIRPGLELWQGSKNSDRILIESTDFLTVQQRYSQTLNSGIRPNWQDFLSDKILLLYDIKARRMNPLACTWFKIHYKALSRLTVMHGML